jgi:hypothetical protein
MMMFLLSEWIVLTFFRVLARNRVLVVMDWLKSYVFGRDVSRE